MPAWRRAAFDELRTWISNPPAPRAVLLSGARQVGKTTLILQVIYSLLDAGVDPNSILYTTFDHPILKIVGLENVLNAWQELRPKTDGIEYLLIDEIQNVPDWQVWLKHQVDFQKARRIAVTGSSLPLVTEGLESGVGRWHTIRLSTLSFREYLQIKHIDISVPQNIARSLVPLFDATAGELLQLAEFGQGLVAHFHSYLLRGGFPQTSLTEDISTAQKLLREDIVDKVLKRDMTALFGVRRVLELEKTFVYLCMHDGGILDLAKLCENLELKKATVTKFIDYLEACNLIYKLAPYGYGKEVLRAKYKIYLADAAISGSVLLKGKSLIEDQVRLGSAVETALFKHVFTRYYQVSVGFSYWRKKDSEVDIIAEVGGDIIPFEVKYKTGPIDSRDLRGLKLLCEHKRISRGYIVTGDYSEFGRIIIKGQKSATPILKVPAPLACYLLSQSEV
ncbi:MAG TPA: ATP-binding protein [Candidatus Deferrimicrobium sp.]|nr:ATP-binding protein [Candidatus Deferrimicrobium sp.]